MRAVVFEEFGEPREVLRLQELPAPEPGPGEVRVRMIAAPVNPSDLLVVQGIYGKLPPLPATPGFEGTGVVEQSGGGLLGRRLLGRRVAVLGGGGSWREQVVLPARQAVPVPRDLPDEQAATFFINPATAVALLERVLVAPRGEWLLQTAAASTLGRMVVALARHRGVRTINVVRRAAAADELRALGADAVIDSSIEPIEPRVRELTGGRGVRYLLDAVGGEEGSAALRALAPGGRMVVYGTLSGEKIAFDPRALMVGGKQVSGFWLAEWVAAQSLLGRLRLVRRVAALLRSGVLASQIGGCYPLERFAEAIEASRRPGGKVLLRFDAAVE